jgi:hypothetical protein
MGIHSPQWGYGFSQDRVQSKNSSRWVDRAQDKETYLVIIQRIPKYDRDHCQNRPSTSSLTPKN